MFGIPHRIFLISVFSLRIWFEHFSELTCTVISFLDAKSQQEFHFNNDVILLNISMEGMFLENLVIWTFAWFTELTGTIHPSPEIFGGGNNIVWNIVEDIVELIVCWISSEIWMFIVSLNLK